LLVLLDIVQTTQSGLRLRQHGDTDVQRLKQDIRRHVEDLQEQARVQDTREKKPGRRLVKKQRQLQLQHRTCPVQAIGARRTVKCARSTVTGVHQTCLVMHRTGAPNWVSRDNARGLEKVKMHRTCPVVHQTSHRMPESPTVGNGYCPMAS